VALIVWHVVALTLLALGVAVEVVGTLGLVLFRDTYQRLHAAGAAPMSGALLICMAAVADRGFDTTGLGAIAVALFLLGSGPVVTHATARAVHVSREHQ
jgi:multicomponent Na+:H+ antiporter subunit G